MAQPTNEQIEKLEKDIVTLKADAQAIVSAEDYKAFTDEKDENGNFKPSEAQAKFDGIMADVANKEAQVKGIRATLVEKPQGIDGEHLEATAKEYADRRNVSADEQQARMVAMKSAMGAWMQGGDAARAQWRDRNPEQAKLEADGIKANALEVAEAIGAMGDMPAEIKAAVTKGNAGSGGNWVPTEMSSMLNDRSVYITPIREVATVETRDNLRNVDWPIADNTVLDDTGAANAKDTVLAAENTATGTADRDIDTRKRTTRPQRIVSAPIDVSYEHLSGSVVGSADYVMRLLNRKLSQKEHKELSTGAAGNPIEGYTRAAAERTMSGKTFASTIKDLRVLLGGLDHQKRVDAMALMNDDVAQGYVSQSIGAADARGVDEMAFDANDQTRYRTRQGVGVLVDTLLPGLTNGELVANTKHIWVVHPDGFLIVDYPAFSDVRRFEEEKNYDEGNVRFRASKYLSAVLYAAGGAIFAWDTTA